MLRLSLRWRTRGACSARWPRGCGVHHSSQEETSGPVEAPWFVRLPEHGVDHVQGVQGWPSVSQLGRLGRPLHLRWLCPARLVARCSKAVRAQEGKRSPASFAVSAWPEWRSSRIEKPIGPLPTDSASHDSTVPFLLVTESF